MTAEEEHKKWSNVHGPLKTMVYTVLGGLVSTAGYVIRFNDLNIVEKKSDLKSLNLRRVWSCWDLAFDRWQKELNLSGYKNRDIYKLAERFRNIAFTIIDNDGAYVKLIYQFMSSWEEVKDDDKYIKDEE